MAEARVCAVGDVDPGAARRFDVDGHRLCVVRLGDSAEGPLIRLEPGQAPAKQAPAPQAPAPQGYQPPGYQPPGYQPGGGYQPPQGGRYQQGPPPSAGPLRPCMHSMLTWPIRFPFPF